MKSEKGGFVYENDSVKITYDFWSKHGLMSFEVYNKMPIPIYIDWRKCSYINKDGKYDYWKDVETIDAATISAGRDYSVNTKVFNPTISVPENGGVTTYGTITNEGESVSGSASVSKAVKTKQERVTFLAPQTSIKRSQFVLFPPNGVAMVKENIEYSTVKKSYDTSKTSVLIIRNYDSDESILPFRNFLTLSTTESFSNEFYVNNGFYVSNICTIESKHFDGSWNSPLSYGYGISKNFYVNLDLDQSNYVQKTFMGKSNKISIGESVKYYHTHPDN